MRGKRKSIKSDLKKVDAIKDGEIDYSDIPALDGAFFKKALSDWPPRKKTVTIRLDEDVLGWLKGRGRGYQTRINKLLRQYMEAGK
jgi:uncharacterized protein (DUF4415 family)